MNEISKQEIEALVKLQEAESEVVRLKKVLEKVEVEKTKLSTKLKQFENALDVNRESLSKARAASKDIEREIQMIDDRIVRSNEKLRMVKTNKEYQLLLREVDDYRNRKDVLDSVVIRTAKTYPAYFGSYNQFDHIRMFVDKIPNLYMVGRNGLHRYNNQDHSMLTSMTAVDNISKGITSNFAF